MQPVLSTHPADALALLLRQRDLQPYLDQQDVHSLGVTCKGLRAIVSPVEGYTTQTQRNRYAQLVARQIRPSAQAQRAVTDRLSACFDRSYAVRERAEEAFADCRDLLWGADALARGSQGWRHTEVHLSSEQRRCALALFLAALRGHTMPEAFAAVDRLREFDVFTIADAAGNDFAIAAALGLGGSGAYQGAHATLASAQATARWWAVGGRLGKTMAVVFGAATGGLAVASGAAVYLGARAAAHFAGQHKAMWGRVPYSEEQDLLIADHITGRAGMRKP